MYSPDERISPSLLRLYVAASRHGQPGGPPGMAGQGLVDQYMPPPPDLRSVILEQIMRNAPNVEKQLGINRGVGEIPQSSIDEEGFQTPNLMDEGGWNEQ